MKGNVPSRKKLPFPIGSELQGYLEKYGRQVSLPLQYDDMSRFFTSVELRSAAGNETYWNTVYYGEREAAEMNQACCQVYALLKTDGDLKVIEHLEVDRIDYCLFGNTNPYRVRIINRLNDNYDHFYIKKVDASRIYGLELENLLSPNFVSFLYDRFTIIEEHVAGIPGDTFMEQNLNVSTFEKIRIAKEFVKFNERCFVRLLGDMRAYNYVIDITPDIEGNQYRLRAIDFDQQSYEGRKNFYLPQYFKDNKKIIDIGIKHLTYESVKQYQMEERSLIARRIRNEHEQLRDLTRVMIDDRISEPKKIKSLSKDLGQHQRTDKFDDCKSMGEIVSTNLELLASKEFSNQMKVGKLFY